MKPLGFRIESVPATGVFAGSPPQMFKIRDNGLRGPCVGDEAELWIALQEALAENATLRSRNSEMKIELDSIRCSGPEKKGKR